MTVCCVLLLLLQLPATAQPEVPIEVAPDVRLVVERFFAAQQQENVEEYLALWSSKVPAAQRPTLEQLKYIFESGDDQFTDLVFTHAVVEQDRARVRIRVTRVRTDAKLKRPDGLPRVFNTRLSFALALVREEGEWKILREGSPADELAGALVEEPDPSVRGGLLAANPDLVTAGLVEALFRRAGGLAQQQQYERAQHIYERALEVARRVKEPKALGQALQNLANSFYFQRKYDLALPLYEERLSMERAAANDEGIASALSGLATVRYTTYDYNAALEAYREVLALQEKLDDESAVATTLISIGNVLYLHGEYDGAIASYRRAEGLKRKYQDLAGAAMALEGLGRVYTAQGDYASALEAYAVVLTDRRTRNLVDGQAVVSHSIGEIHLRLGNLDASRTSFADSRELFLKTKDLSGAGRTWMGTALVELVAGRPGEGEKAYSESIAACGAAKDGVCVARAQVGLAFALAAQQKYADAVPWYRKAIAAFTTMVASDPAYREPLARSQVGLAEALTGDGKFHESLKESEHARHAGIVLNNDDVVWRALLAQARAERRLKRGSVALGVAKAAVATVRQMSAASLDRPTHAVSRDSTSAYATLAVIQAEAGDAAGAFETAEEMRTHALRLWLAANETEIARGLSDEERAEERALGAEVRGLLAKRERITSLPKVEKADVDRLDVAIAGAIARRAAARERMFARHPHLQAWRALVPPASASDVRQILTQPGTMLLSFVVDEKDVVVMTAAAGVESDEAVVIAAHVLSLDRQTLGERIARALDTGPLNDAVEWRKASAEVFAVLPPPVVAALDAATRVLVVPDDVLWRVPFEAFSSSRGFLGEAASVSYLPSVTTALRAPAVERAPANVPIAAIAAPDLPPSLTERLKTTAPTWTLRSPEQGADEAEAVLRHVTTALPSDHDGAQVTGARATVTAMREAIASAGAILMGAPFRVNSASPLFSSVLAATDTIADPEGPADATDLATLDVREIFNLETSAAVVTFSDPATLSMRDAAAALSPVYWGWRAAGAGTILVRRWGGADERATAVLAEFHRELATGKAPHDALRAAQASVRRADGGRAPGGWAGWLLMTATLRTGTDSPASR